MSYLDCHLCLWTNGCEASSRLAEEGQSLKGKESKRKTIGTIRMFQLKKQSAENYIYERNRSRTVKFNLVDQDRDRREFFCEAENLWI